MPYIDNNGKVWTRSEDRRSITCEDGRMAYANEAMTDEAMVYAVYSLEVPTKTDAERIAELEAQVAALLSRLS